MLKRFSTCVIWTIPLLIVSIGFAFAQEESDESTIKAVQADSALRALAAVKVPPGAAVLKRANQPKGTVFGLQTEEEKRFLQSDYTPVSLQQRGRLSGVSVRGLPVGGLEQTFIGHRLRNPFFGYRNEQLISLNRIGSRTISPTGTSESIETRKPISNKPESTILFSQDYVLDLNYLDINFAQRLSPKTYIQLAGTNFSGNGSIANGYSRFALYTYHAQLSTQLSEKWSADFLYWQMRHRYNLAPEAVTLASVSGSSVREGFKQVNHELWVRLRGKLSRADSIEFVPEYTTIEDRFVQEGVRRNNRYHLPGASLAWLFGNGTWMIGGKTNFSYMDMSAERNFRETNEWDGYTGFAVEKKRGSLQLDVQAGLYRHSEFGNAFSGSAALKLQQGEKLAFHFGASVRPRPIPFLWRTISDTLSIGAYTGDDLIQQREISAKISFKAGALELEAMPFYMSTTNLPLKDSIGIVNEGWSIGDSEYPGLRARGALNWKAFYLQHDLTWYPDEIPLYDGRINAITRLNLSLNLFGGSFPLDGAASFRYMGNYRVSDFDRMLMLFQPVRGTRANNLISDARLQSYFRDAAIFFIWENLLQDDYVFVNSASDNFLVFKLGVEWILFD